jgi:hypothetical protein
MADQEGFTDEQIRLVLESRGIDGADIDRLLQTDKTREFTEERVKSWIREALSESQQAQHPQGQAHDFATRLANGLASSQSAWVSGTDAGGDDGPAAA